MLPLHLRERTEDERRALRCANGLDLERETATEGALLVFVVVIAALVGAMVAGG